MYYFHSSPPNIVSRHNVSNSYFINTVKFYYWKFRRTSPNSVVSNLEANKYKLLMKIPLDDVEIVKGTTNIEFSLTNA